MFKQKEIYRPNVGIIIINTEGNLMWCRRKNHDGWQFPQGGIDENESPIEAAIREVEEETGLAEQDLNFIWESKSWFFYDVPKERRNNTTRICENQSNIFDGYYYKRWFVAISNW